MTEAMADAQQQQQQSLTTGKDTKKTTLTTRAVQPNKKREGGHLWSNIVVIAFCIAGLVLTLYAQVRGDDHLFKISFIVALAISGAEIILNIVVMILSSRKSDNAEEEENKKCGQGCISALISFIYLAGCCVAFGLLVAALMTSSGVENSEIYGCANGFGCANIMAIIACIIYGFRVLLIAMCLPCLICATCCACSACCAKAALDRPVDAEAQQQQQNSSL